MGNGPKDDTIATVLIRDATADDWPAIYPFFRTIVDDGRTYALPVGLSVDEARRVWFEPAPWRVFVAIENGVVLGTAKVGPVRAGRGSHVATASFMVDPARAGRGIGAALGHYVIDVARSLGYRAMQFNAVVETNTTAVRLWQRLGFRILATIPEAFDHPDAGLVGLHVMHRRLSSST